MKAENTIWIYYDLWDYDPPNMDWKTFHQLIEPFLGRKISKSFVPQSVADSIWYFYEFPDKETKQAVIESLPVEPEKKKKLIREPDQKLLDHWCRD